MFERTGKRSGSLLIAASIALLGGCTTQRADWPFDRAHYTPAQGARASIFVDPIGPRDPSIAQRLGRLDVTPVKYNGEMDEPIRLRKRFQSPSTSMKGEPAAPVQSAPANRSLKSPPRAAAPPTAPTVEIVPRTGPPLPVLPPAPPPPPVSPQLTPPSPLDYFAPKRPAPVGVEPTSDPVLPSEPPQTKAARQSTP